MKSTALWALALFNILLLGLLVGRGMKPNAAVAQAVASRGDYMIIPVDFPGAPTGSVVVLDNISGKLTAIMTEESSRRMNAIPPVNIRDLFARQNGTPQRR